MQSVVMLSVVKLSSVMPSVVILSVMALVFSLLLLLIRLSVKKVYQYCIYFQCKGSSIINLITTVQ